VPKSRPRILDGHRFTLTGIVSLEQALFSNVVETSTVECPPERRVDDKLVQDHGLLTAVEAGNFDKGLTVEPGQRCWDVLCRPLTYKNTLSNAPSKTAVEKPPPCGHWKVVVKLSAV